MASRIVQASFPAGGPLELILGGVSGLVASVHVEAAATSGLLKVETMTGANCLGIYGAGVDTAAVLGDLTLSLADIGGVVAGGGLRVTRTVATNAMVVNIGLIGV